jgi:hypothetical protein
MYDAICKKYKQAEINFTRVAIPDKLKNLIRGMLKCTEKERLEWD